MFILGGVDWHSTFEVTLQLQLFCTHLWGGVNRQSTFEVTLQLQLFCTHLWKCSSWGGWSTLNFWSDFATTTFLYSPLEMFTLGEGSITTQLLKWICKYNFLYPPLEMYILGGGGDQLTLNFWSDFATATFLYSPLEMFILGGVDRHSTFEVTLQIKLFCTHLWKCSSWGGSIDTQLLKWLSNYNFSVLTFGNVHPGGGRLTLNFWSDFANKTFLYSPLEMFILGGGFNQHSTFEVTLQIDLFCTHLWKCSS